MRTEADRWLGALFHGWVELLVLLLALIVFLAIIGWCWNRGLKPADRGPLVSGPTLTITFALVLLLRHFHDDMIVAIIIAVGVVIAGLISRSMHPRGLVIPLVLLASLLGLGLNLSAVALFLVTALAALLAARSTR